MLFGRLLERRDTSYQNIWGADLDAEASPMGMAQRVTRDKALGLSAVFSCVRLITDTVSTLPLKRYRRGPAFREELEAPDWVDRPIPRDPSVTREVHLQQVVSSLLLDGNGFTLVSPDVFRPAELRVLDPRHVEVRRGADSAPVYEVRDHRGGIVGEFDATRIIHIPLIRLAGELRGVSPIEAERLTFLSAVAAEEASGRFMRGGMWLSAMVKLPPTANLTDPQIEALQKRIEQKWNGSRNAGKVGVLTGGAELQQLSITPEQAQFLETRQYDDERIFRIFRCPPALVGMVREGAVAYASSVMQAEAFEKHTIRPLVTLIETAYRRLVAPDEFLRFNTAALLRADLMTRYNAHASALQNRWQKVDEVRLREDLEPFGDEGGGLLDTPNNTVPPDEGPAEPARAA